ncbi:MAG: hypothetical protein EAZ92_11640 [Candidatus Kapaibacterium sp.]|nr:MAG: hypothetical protein EAZ92_11640 [Candidatus Kapabacteria bacterium]
MNNTRKAALGLSLSVITGTLITVFLMRNIFAIPRGTHEGGVIAASGIAIILASMGIVSFGIAKIFPSKESISH